MKRPSDAEIRKRIDAIDADDRFHYPPALVEINAPLALIQVGMSAEIRALAWCLGIPAPKSGPRSNAAANLKGRK